MLLSSLIVSLFSLLSFGVSARPTASNDHNVLQNLADGNDRYVAKMTLLHPGLLEKLARKGQNPPYLIFECVDSRAREALIFDLHPGDMFTSASIANQFHSHDTNTLATLAYAVDHVHIQHVIVMGHYGCGGVQAAIQSPAMPSSNGSRAIQEWIKPVHDIYLTSNRSEIVEYRGAHGGQATEDDSHMDRRLPVFRALVEENVKENVLNVYRSSVIQEFYSHNGSSAYPNIFIHGAVYDIDTGRVYDLRVSRGPPGISVPTMPFPTLQ